MKHKTLREYIRLIIAEQNDVYSLPADEPQLDTIFDRKTTEPVPQLGDEDSISPHLSANEEDYADKYGPVPPRVGVVRLIADPYAKDTEADPQ